MIRTDYRHAATRTASPYRRSTRSLSTWRSGNKQKSSAALHPATIGAAGPVSERVIKMGSWRLADRASAALPVSGPDDAIFRTRSEAHRSLGEYRRIGYDTPNGRRARVSHQLVRLLDRPGRLTTNEIYATPYVFLSYASADRARAVRMADLLEAKGFSVWID